MIYTTNWIERFNRSARRTLKIRGAFPNEESVLALITSVAIDKSRNYIVYRYGAPGQVELVYKMKKQEKKNRFHYVQDDGYGYTRYEIRQLNFTINNYTYSIYNNYIEAHETAVDGVGVVIKNNKTKKSVTLKGDKTSVFGKLALLKNIDWMDVSLAVDGERIE